MDSSGHWGAPRWDSNSHNKHRRATVRDWERSFAKARSGEQNGRAQYNPNLTFPQLQSLEVECIPDPSDKNKVTAGMELSHLATENQRFFFRDCTDVLGSLNAIGASRGEFTNYIFVIYQIDGSVHGYPILASELKKSKGARLA